MGSFLSENRTKITGAVIVLIGFLQLTDNAEAIKRLLGEDAFAVWNLVAGGLVVVLGFLNTAAAEARGAAKAQGGFARPSLLLAISAVCLIAALSVQGCAGTKAAYAAAKSPDETAYVVAEHYAVLVEQAATVAEQPGVPVSAVRSLQAADRAAAPAIETLKPARDAYLAVKSPASGKSLQEALDEAGVKVAAMIRALKAARGVQ